MSTSFIENTFSSTTVVSFTEDKINFIWTIDNFLFLTKKSHLKDGLVNFDESVESAEFNFSNRDEKIVRFKLFLWPCLVSRETENVAIALEGLPGVDRAKFYTSQCKCLLSLIDSTGNQLHSVGFENIQNSIADEPTGDCWVEFMPRDYLLKNKETLLPDGILKIKCEIDFRHYFSASTSKAVSEYTPTVLNSRTLRDDLENLLNEGKNWDLELICGDATFRVHKAILSARSQVFCKMFESDMAESKTGVVNISDIEGSVMRKLLRYIYGIEIEIPKPICIELYLAADKYGLMELRLLCSSMLMANLSTSNIWDVAIAADALNDHELFSSAKAFVKENAASLLSKDLVEFATKSTEVANRLVD